MRQHDVGSQVLELAVCRLTMVFKANQSVLRRGGGETTSKSVISEGSEVSDRCGYVSGCESPRNAGCCER